LIAAWPSVCSSLTVVPSHSRTFLGRPGHRESEASRWLTAFVGVKWFMDGMDGVTVCTLHVHRGTASAGDQAQDWQRFASTFAQDLRSGGVRLVAGDANMSLFRLAAWMQEREGIQMELIARAVGLNINEPVAAMDERGLRKNILHDSCGIWVVGPRGPCRPLTLDTRFIVSACHPALFEKTHALAGTAQRRSTSATGKVLTRGYVQRSYRGTGDEHYEANHVPTHETVDAVLRLWGAHVLQPWDQHREV